MPGVITAQSEMGEMLTTLDGRTGSIAIENLMRAEHFGLETRLIGNGV